MKEEGRKAFKFNLWERRYSLSIKHFQTAGFNTDSGRP
jgi:hypothetical protein